VFSLLCGANSQTTAVVPTTGVGSWWLVAENCIPNECGAEYRWSAFSLEQCESEVKNYVFGFNSLAYSPTAGLCCAFSCQRFSACEYNAGYYYYTSTLFEATTQSVTTGQSPVTTGLSGYSWQELGQNVAPRSCQVISVSTLGFYDCELKCDPTGSSCNTISYNYENDECILRHCPYPRDEQLVAAPGFLLMAWLQSLTTGAVTTDSMTTDIATTGGSSPCESQCVLLCSTALDQCCYTCDQTSCPLPDSNISLQFYSQNGARWSSPYAQAMAMGYLSGSTNVQTAAVWIESAWVGYVYVSGDGFYFNDILNATCS